MLMCNLLTDQLSINITSPSLKVREGGTATLTATANGKNMQNFKYQWRKRGSNSLPNKVSSINGTVLTIPNFLESDEGQYYCIVTNEWDRSVESNNITLILEGMQLACLKYICILEYLKRSRD